MPSQNHIVDGAVSLLFNQTDLPRVVFVVIPLVEMIICSAFPYVPVVFVFIVAAHLFMECLRWHYSMPSLGNPTHIPIDIITASGELSSVPAGNPHPRDQLNHFRAVFVAACETLARRWKWILFPLLVDAYFHSWLSTDKKTRFVLQVVSLVAGQTTMNWHLFLRASWGYGGPSGCYDSDGRLRTRLS